MDSAGVEKVCMRQLEYLRRISPAIPAVAGFPSHLSRACSGQPARAGGVDLLLATDQDAVSYEAVFGRLRWGGQLVYVTRCGQTAQEVQKQLCARGGLVLEHAVRELRTPFLGVRLPWVTPRHYWLAVTKTLLVPPGQSSERFTYHVELLRHKHLGDEYVVMKQVPTCARVLARLREKFPDTAEEELKRRARKFTDKIFPVFLTREAGILKILQQRLPEAYKCRVPRVLGVEKDNNGFVKTLYMNWLRNTTPVVGGTNGGRGAGAGGGGRELTQLEFALQATALLEAVHDVAGVIHLDLRLDNIVVTRHGVGFVDFGSAVRVGESLQESTLLTNLFDEMMRTSQIQRMLGRMQDIGMVTSAQIRNSYHKVDKAIDFFYLAVQINDPLANSDFWGLVQCLPDSQEARQIANLTAEILRPRHPDRPAYQSAGEIRRGLERIHRHLRGEIAGDSALGMAVEGARVVV